MSVLFLESDLIHHPWLPKLWGSTGDPKCPQLQIWLSVAFPGGGRRNGGKTGIGAITLSQ
jgi:hypothetical protein